MVRRPHTFIFISLGLSSHFFFFFLFIISFCVVTNLFLSLFYFATVLFSLSFYIAYMHAPFFSVFSLYGVEIFMDASGSCTQTSQTTKPKLLVQTFLLRHASSLHSRPLLAKEELELSTRASCPVVPSGSRWNNVGTKLNNGTKREICFC